MELNVSNPETNIDNIASRPIGTTKNISDEEVGEIAKNLSDGALILSIPHIAVQEAGGLQAFQEILKESKFIGTYNGKEKIWSLKTFYGNRDVSAKSVSAMKVANYTNANLLNVVKHGGGVLAVVGIGASTLQYINGDIGEIELSADVTFTMIGLYGGPFGASVSTMYFLGKFVTTNTHELKSDVGGYDLSNQQIRRSYHQVPEK